MKLLVIHGPNLNLLGTREPEIYGTRTLDDLNALLSEKARSRGAELETLQSNHEGEIIDRIHLAGRDGTDAIIINPGAYTHTSVAIFDALRGVSLPAIEVHISNLHARGDRRSNSVTAGACRGVISGFGFESYVLAIDAAVTA